MLGIERYSSRNSTQPRFLVDLLPEVSTPISDAQLFTILRPQSSEREIALLLGQLEEKGSIYLSQLNLLIAREFKLSSAAEEAARFLHHACSACFFFYSILRAGLPLPDRDKFYAHAIEHALAYFGSRVLCGGSEGLCEESTLEPSTSEFAGYLLADQLYDDFIAGRLSRRQLRQVFLAKLHEPGKAKTLFRELSRKRRGAAGH